MNDKDDLTKLGLAFAVGVALSAGYVALAINHSGTDLVVVQERCPEATGAEPTGGRARFGGLQLAPLPGEVAVPEGYEVRVSLDGLWLGGAEEPLVHLDAGRIPDAELDGPSIRAVQAAVADGGVPAVLWLDRRVPGVTLQQLLFTLTRAGFEDFAFVSEGGVEGPGAYMFAANRFDADTEEPEASWGAGLSLRLGADGTTVWLRPQIDGRPGLRAPDPVALDLGGAGSKDCVLGDRLPDAATLAALERQLCELDGGGPLGVEFVFDLHSGVGELLALRALDARTEGCRGPTFIAWPNPAWPHGCGGAVSASEIVARFAAAPRTDIESTAVRSKVVGALDKDEIRAVVIDHIDEIRHCYNLGLSEDPELAGSVVIDFVITETGEVRDPGLNAATQLGAPEVERCMVEALASWTFPKPETGLVEVTYPFVLSPG